MNNHSQRERDERSFKQACDHVSVDEAGAVVYQSVFEREWKAAGGDFDRLLALIEDHLYEDDDNDGDESIDWNAVEKEYRQGTEQEAECKSQGSNQLMLPSYPAISG